MGVRSSSTIRAAAALAALMVSLSQVVKAELPKPHGGSARSPGQKAGGKSAAHRIAIVEGEVKAGQGFERAIGNGLKVLLEPIASGWVLRVIPAQGSRGTHDYAELATPPYQSVSPLLLSTDFSFRAQDALAWNPRRFRFAADPASFADLSATFEQYQRLVKAGTAAASDLRITDSHLAALVSRAPEGELTILDARLVQGTGDQAQAAALVASHPNGSARQIDQPANGIATPLGRLDWLRFRIRLDLPDGFRAERGLQIERKGAF